MEWHTKPNVGDHQRAGVSDERGEDRHLNPQWEKQNDFRRREQRRKAEARGAVCSFCRLLLMRHMWEATETMSHSHNATVATIGSEQPRSVKDNCVSACHLAADFSPVIHWLFTVYPVLCSENTQPTEVCHGSALTSISTIIGQAALFFGGATRDSVMTSSYVEIVCSFCSMCLRACEGWWCAEGVERWTALQWQPLIHW